MKSRGASIPRRMKRLQARQQERATIQVAIHDACMAGVSFCHDHYYKKACRVGFLARQRSLV